MEFTIQRRIGGAKYGKTTKKVVVHDFFGWDQKPTSASTTSKSYLISPVSSDSDAVPREDVAVQQPGSPTVRSVASVVRTPAASPRPTRSSPSSAKRVPTQQNERSIFDLDFSDDDTRTAKDTKRRKLETRLRPQPAVTENADATRPIQPEDVKIREQPAQLNTRETKLVVKSSAVGQELPLTLKKSNVLVPGGSTDTKPLRSTAKQTSVVLSKMLPKSVDTKLPEHVERRPASRTRRRLLDAPDISVEATRPDNSVQPRTHEAIVKSTSAQTPVEPDKPNPRSISLVRNESSNGRRTYGRVKATYSGREQSRLNHMVDEVDSTSTTSSQDASQQIISQLTLQTQPSQLQLQLELDNESSDDGAFGNKLKSIHELRLAGTASRVDREVDSLMEDLDPSIKTNSKPLRLQALMKLIRRNTEASFVSMLAQKATDRLASWSKRFSDEISLCLLHIVLWQLVRQEQSSLIKLRVLFDALATGEAITLSSMADLNKLSKDRKQNLSKATSKDIADFESELANGAIIPDLNGDRVCIAAVTLGALNDALRALLAQGETQLPIAAGRLATTIKSVKDCSAEYHSTEDSPAKHVTAVFKAALSLLQLCSGPLNIDLNLGIAGYKQLATCLSNVAAISDDLSVIQAILHFTISLSNDKPAICSATISSGFGSTVMQITSTKLRALLQQTRERDSIDQGELDCVILCLACMLNLTEHDNSARLEFSINPIHSAERSRHHTSISTTDNDDDVPRPHSNISHLISLYTTLAPLLIGTQSASMGQLLVAFGYLSLLICSLARANTVKDQIISLLIHQNTETNELEIDDIIASAKEFLIYLHIVESQQNPDDPTAFDDDTEEAIQMLNEQEENKNGSQSSGDGLTRRFEAIIVDLEATLALS